MTQYLFLFYFFWFILFFLVYLFLFIFCLFIFCLFGSFFCLFIFLFVYFLLKLTELETAEEKKTKFEKCFRWNCICWSLISKTSTVELSDHNEFITMNDLRNHLVNHCSKVRKIGYNSFVFLFVYFILYKLINIFFCRYLLIWLFYLFVSFLCFFTIIST